jgi:hypothetical protein
VVPVVTIALLTTVCCYPAAYGGARLFGFIVHRAWEGPDHLRHDEVECDPRPLCRVFRPFVKVESRLRHFDGGKIDWGRVPPGH